MESFILLENITFYANHGVLEQETIVGNIYIVNLKIKVDLKKASLSDDIDDTINYANVYEDIKQEMMVPSKLLEHAANRIVSRLKMKYTQIKSIELKLSKRNPPIGGQLDYASVILID